ncbi:hypothetical protein QJS10_CPB21g00453 [Acorus calamus]|uniref:Uncharacterized protein n=1 Tax=Acorus calamus TaxID=4465 RepID=A0AAV9C588_ACOCL|nr:hypothetical protein QJS10_CPB21g00453 [Acorus calamus]
MAMKEGHRNSSMSNSSNRNQNLTLREENTGKKRVCVSTILKVQHLQRLAKWVGGEALVSPLGALLGHCLASVAEAEGVPLDQSLFPCQRCETILQPGYNCTVRIERGTHKARRCKGSTVPMQNSVVYTCKFCSHRNLKRGGTKGYVKEISTAKMKLEKGPPSGSENSEKMKGTSIDVISSKPGIQCSPATPFKKMCISSSSENKKPCKKGAVNSGGCADSAPSDGRSKKRRRKSWSSLKEIVERKEQQASGKLGGLAVPFAL